MIKRLLIVARQKTFSLLLLLFLLLAVFFTYYLTQKKQDIRKKAASEVGEMTKTYLRLSLWKTLPYFQGQDRLTNALIPISGVPRAVVEKNGSVKIEFYNQTTKQIIG